MKQMIQVHVSTLGYLSNDDYPGRKGEAGEERGKHVSLYTFL